MHDSKRRPSAATIHKLAIFFLVSGAIILAIAGVVLYQRRHELQTPPDQPKIDDPTVAPVPLVISQPTRPLEAKKEDAGTENTGADSKKEEDQEAKRSTSNGSIDTKKVNEYINSRFSLVRACYERRLKVNSFLEGKLDLSIRISTRGRVTSIRVNENTVRDRKMLSCVKRTIKKWRFPKPTGGSAVIAKTFNFKKSD